MLRFPRKLLDLLLGVVVSATVGLGAPAFMAAPALAEDCPGHPDALGTSRVLVVDPAKIRHVGVMQYSQSLPLADKEVVLTFDDGPIPPHSTEVLDILAAQCVKATFFLVGEMAREHPAVVRRIHEEGHTIGTHTEHHPGRMHKLPLDKVRAEIDRGIADIGGALWDFRDLAPFFRIPGLARSDVIEKEAADRSLVIFSSDTVADDWHRRIRSADITRLALSRLEARGKGILLLHDIHHVTVAALPDLLNKLKAAGFHVVHIVPGTGEQPEVAAASPLREPAPASPASATAAPAQAQPSVSAAVAATSPAPPEKKDGDQPAPVVVPSSGPSADSKPDAPSNALSTDSLPSAPSNTLSTDAPPSGSQAAANVQAPAAGEPAQPTLAANPDQVANANALAQPERREGDRTVPDASTSVEPPEATSDSSHDADDPNWPSPVAVSPADDRAELPAPDERAFSIDYRPWQTVKLAVGSETAVYLAIDAVPQWTDPPVSVAAGPDNAELPAPAVPRYYFGGGDTVTAVAE
jgi:peptidoglycan/xylan/chitin deacetylase (PgdA/CDA1 family)